MRFWKPAIWLGFLLLTMPAACCLAQDSFPTEMMGPADLRNQRPFQLIFLAFSPESASVLENGRSAGSAQLDIANNLLIPRTSGIIVHEDAETQRLALKVRRGIGRGLEASVMLPVIARNGGILDKLISNYHVLINDTHTTPDDAPGRNKVSSYHSEIFFTRPNGTNVVDLHPAAGLGDVQFTLKKSLWSRGSTAGAIRGGVKLPTGNSGTLLGSGGIDTGVDLDAQASFGSRLTGFVNASYVWMQKAHGLDAYTQRNMIHGAAAFEYYSSSHSSWVLQDDLGQPGIKTGNNFADGTQGTISIAYKYSPREDTLLTYAFTENGGVVADRASWVANVGPDPTLSFGWTRFY